MLKMNTTTDPQDELLFQVNEKNEVLGSISRGEAHSKKGVYYRTIYVLVFNKKNEVLIQKRSSTKDLYPNCWDLSVGGHVNWGDGYEETAVREINEELGLKMKKSDLITKGDVLVNLANSGEFFRVFEYKLKPGEKINTLEEEVADTKWVSLQELKESINSGSLKWYPRPVQTIEALY